MGQERSGAFLQERDPRDGGRCRQFTERGVEVLRMPASGDADRPRVDLPALLRELGRRKMTHLLVEGGATLLGSLFDEGLVDECHVFVAPKIVGGGAIHSAGSIMMPPVTYWLWKMRLTNGSQVRLRVQV